MEDRYLFKAKRIDNGEWVIGNLITNVFFRLGQSIPYILCPDKAEYDCFEDFTEENGIFEVRPDTICQCTGLKDKNGKLIWENDVVDFLGHRGIVKFECGSFGIAYEKHIDWDEIQANIMPLTGCENTLYACENDNYISLWEIYWNFNDEDDSVSTVEVIGNIFDNKELLESEESNESYNFMWKTN
jgi:uncharacterized phage protein (TIGR01671 family)